MRAAVLNLIIILSVSTSFAVDFNLVSGLSCPSDSQHFCDVTQPKGWSESEALLIESSLQKLHSLGLEKFLKAVQSNGFSRIGRYGYGFTITPMSLSVYERREGIYAFTDASTHMMGLFNYFFENPVSMDPISKQSPKDITLLHELVHARDFGGVFSKSQEFLELANFEEGTYQGVTQKEYYEMSEVLYEKNEAKEFQGAYLAERIFGISHGVPRHYSMSSPQEFLADIAAFSVYDPTASTYINPKLLKWVREKVLLLEN